MGGRGAASPGSRGADAEGGSNQAESAESEISQNQSQTTPTGEGDELDYMKVIAPTPASDGDEGAEAGSTKLFRLNLREKNAPYGSQPIELETEEDTNSNDSNQKQEEKTDEENQEAGQPPDVNRISVASELPQPPSVTIVESGGRGKVWKRNLRDQFVEQTGKPGERMEISEAGFRVVRVADGAQLREMKFYPGFSWDKLDYTLPKELGLQIIESRGLQRLVIKWQPSVAPAQNQDDTGTPTASETNDAQKKSQIKTKQNINSILKRVWKLWQKGQAKGKLKVQDFTSYVGDNGYVVRLDEKAPVTEIENYYQLNYRAQVEAVLSTTEPDLQAKLPQRLQIKLNELLNNDHLLARSPLLSQTRAPLIARVNAMLGENIENYQEFQTVMKAVEQPGSRGAIGEMFFRRFFAGDQTKKDEMRKPRFEGNWYSDSSASQPDRLRPAARRTLDVKVGYNESAIDAKQMKRYAKLVQSSKTTKNQEFKQLLDDLGLQQMNLRGHDYVFLSDGEGKIQDTAERAMRSVIKSSLQDIIKVFYVDEVASSDKMDTQGVYELEFDEDTKKYISTFVGSQLPD